MRSHVDSAVKIQTTSESNFSPPSWFGEIVVISRYLRTHGVLSKINEQVRFARKRFGRVSGDRFSGGALWLRHQRRTHAGRVLPAAPVEALRTLLTSRSAQSPTRPCLHREANRRPGGSRRKHLGGL